jgi:ribonuclease Z
VAHIASLSSTFSNSTFYSTGWSIDGVPKTVEDPPYVVRTVYHICGLGVLEDESYKTFMRGFGTDVHVSLNVL